MTFPPGPPPGRSLPTWHREKAQNNTEGEHKKAQKDKLSTLRKSLRIVFRSKKAGITCSTSKLGHPEDKVSSATNEPSFRLLDLPRELRDRIYSFMVRDSGADPCNYFNPPSYKRFETRPLLYNLQYNACMLASCHQVQQEFAQMLCLEKTKSAVPAVTIVINEISPYTGRGPYYYKNYQPVPIHASHLTFLAPFVQFLQSVDVRMNYSPVPGKTRWDPVLTIPDDVHISLIPLLVSALKDGNNLRSVRIRLYLDNARFESGWLNKEITHLRLIRGFELIQIDFLWVIDRSCTMTHTVWALPQANGVIGWKHIDRDIKFFYPWRGPHGPGRTALCFQCWVVVQQAGLDDFPGFGDHGSGDESFLKVKKLEAPDFTMNDWKKWKVPKKV